MQPTLPNGSSKYGAKMGRCSHPGTIDGSLYTWVQPELHAPEDLPRKFYLRSIGPDRHGYDEAGAYWGVSDYGSRIYWAHDPKTGADYFVRGYDREHAKRCVLTNYPNATFYR